MKSTSALIIRKALCCLFFTLLMVTVLFAGYIACVIKTSAGNASMYYYLGVFSGCFPWIILIAFSCLNVFLLIAINKTNKMEENYRKTVKLCSKVLGVAVIVLCFYSLYSKTKGIVLGVENDWYYDKSGLRYSAVDNQLLHDGFVRGGIALSNHGYYSVSISEDGNYVRLGQFPDGRLYKVNK